MRNLTNQDFSTLWPSAPSALVTGLLASQAAVWQADKINTDLRLAHFMAQISEESAGGTELVESLNYSAAALLKQWSRHFTPAQANEYGRTSSHPANQPMIGNLAYGGRMGNAPYPSNDGYDYRGRGLLQITGKDAYLNIGNHCGLDLVGHPDLIVDPNHALTIAATEFVLSGCLPYCDQDNVLAVSALINVGHVVTDPSKVIGFASRKAWLGKWKGRLGI